MHKNKTNGKVYIGITRQAPEKRWGTNGKNYTHGYFKYAIQKYGWDNFEHIILYSKITKEKACKIEQELIAEYHSNEREYGYNLSIGGEVNMGFKSEAISESKMKPVLQYDFDGKYLAEYPSIMQAAETLGCNRTHISSVCTFKRLQANGYVWRFKNDEYRPNVDLDIHIPQRKKETIKKVPSPSRTKPVDQYSLDGKFIQSFDTLTKAEEYCGHTSKCSHISECCKGIRQSAHGYIWAYSGEDAKLLNYKSRKSVIQYDLNHNKVNVFPTVREATRSVNGNDGYLIKHLQGKILTPYKGYFWEYA